MDKITPHNLILSLKHKNIIKRKLLPFINKIVLYANDGVVYKVLIHYHYQTLKKAMKLGAIGEMEMLNISDIMLNVEQRYQNGRLLFSYDQNTQEISIFEGEDVKMR